MRGRSIFRALAFLLGCAPVLAAPATQATISESIAALDTGDATQARRLAEEGLAERDLSSLQRGQLLMTRGSARELLGENVQALDDFTAALQIRALQSQDHAQALLQRGFLLDGLGRLDEAARDYGAAAALKTAVQATALNNRANVYRRQNRPLEAQRDYRRALEANSRNPQYSYFGLGQLAETRNDKLAARGFYARALAADPGYRQAQDRLDALGGPPEGALADPDMVMLHPPRPTGRGPAQVPALPVRRAPVHLSPPALRLVPQVPPIGGAAVQLGAWRSEAEAKSGWEHVRARAGHVLDGLSPDIVTVDLPAKGRFFRLRVMVMDAAGLCSRLHATGQACVPVRK